MAGSRFLPFGYAQGRNGKKEKQQQTKQNAATGRFASAGCGKRVSNKLDAVANEMKIEELRDDKRHRS